MERWKHDLDNWITGHYGEDQFRGDEEEPKEGMHHHTCQQCGKVVTRNCDCEHGDTTNVWCSARCKAAYDL
jgi:hypothetical protein